MKPQNLILTAACCALLAPASPARAKPEKIAVMRMHSQVEVMAPPAAVWTHVTTGKNLVTWCPEWKSEKNASVNIAKVGDVLDFTDAWGGGGRSVVTYLVKNQEIRVAHEPTQGDYMCQAKLVLTPTPKGTIVHYWEQYTDESEAADREATAAKVEAEMAATLSALKKGVEKK